MTPVEVIRRAAKEMREKSEAATWGPGRWRAFTTGPQGGDHWFVGTAFEVLAHVASNDGENEPQRQPLADFIAAFDPAVALAVADWLEKAATTYEAEVNEGMGTSVRRITPALAVARAFLREAS